MLSRQLNVLLALFLVRIVLSARAFVVRRLRIAGKDCTQSCWPCRRYLHEHSMEFGQAECQPESPKKRLERRISREQLGLPAIHEAPESEALT